MIRTLCRAILSLFLGFQYLKFKNVSDNEISLSNETDEKKHNHWGDGILFLGCNFILAWGICILMGKADPLNYSNFHSFSRALLIVSIPAIIIYVLSARMFHYSGTRKFFSLALLLILVNASAFFIGRFFYHHSVENALSAINYSPQIQARQKEINDRIDVISLALQKDPDDKLQAYERIAMIDEMTELHKESYAINIKFMDSIQLAFKQESALTPAELKILLKERYHININIDALPDFREKYQTWYKTETGCLSTKISSYQSYIDDENDHRQALNLKWADSACATSSEDLISMTEARSKFMGTNL